MYEGTKKAFGPTTKKTAPLKSKIGETITDPDKQMDRWVKHYLDLYSKENVVTETATYAAELLPAMRELDELPSEKELCDAIDCQANGKAPGNDGISPEIINCPKTVLLTKLHELLCKWWEEDTVPQYMRDPTIITLYTNKCESSDYNSYRGISLLSILGKAFVRVILDRFQKLAERVIPETQCGFRSAKSTINICISLRLLQEKCREQQVPLCIAFIDLTNAFHLVSRSGQIQLLEKIG